MKKNKKTIELYQLENCPYCESVRLKLDSLKINYIKRNVPEDREKRNELQKISGQRFVPVLVDNNTGVVISDDDEKIIKYLEKTYG